MSSAAKVRFAYRRNQLLWAQHPVYGWVRGKVESRWEFEGHAMYRLVTRHPDGVIDMLITASEKRFFKERP